ncbi:MAG: DUF6011 domain-containing protein [Pyrinomonadaceae bacterium]
MICAACNREMTDPASIARGVGPVCDAKNKRLGEEGKSAEPTVKLLFKSADGIRSWLVNSKPLKHFVRVAPVDEEMTEYVCENGSCLDESHIDAVKKAERELTLKLVRRFAA